MQLTAVQCRPRPTSEARWSSLNRSERPRRRAANAVRLPSWSCVGCMGRAWVRGWPAECAAALLHRRGRSAFPIGNGRWPPLSAGVSVPPPASDQGAGGEPARTGHGPSPAQCGSSPIRAISVPFHRGHNGTPRSTTAGQTRRPSHVRTYPAEIPKLITRVRFRHSLHPKAHPHLRERRAAASSQSSSANSASANTPSHAAASRPALRGLPAAATALIDGVPGTERPAPPARSSPSDGHQRPARHRAP